MPLHVQRMFVRVLMFTSIVQAHLLRASPEHHDHKRLGNNASLHVREQSEKAKTPTQEEYLCASYSGGYCLTGSCDEWRGHVECSGGGCNCKAGYCAGGWGRCVSKSKGVELPGSYKIEPTNSPGKYLYMKSYGYAMSWWKGEPGPQGHWKVVVNNDGTIMMFTEKYGPKYWMSIEDVDDGDMQGSYIRWSSPSKASFQVHQSKEYGEPLHLLHTDHKLWLEKDWDQVDGAWDMGEGTRMNFHPPLTAADGVKIKIHEAPAAKGMAGRAGALLWVLLVSMVMCGL